MLRPRRTESKDAKSASVQLDDGEASSSDDAEDAKVDESEGFSGEGDDDFEPQSDELASDDEAGANEYDVPAPGQRKRKRAQPAAPATPQKSSKTFVARSPSKRKLPAKLKCC